MSTLKSKIISAPINGATVEPLVLQTNNIDRVTVDASGNVLVAGDMTVSGTLIGGVPAGTVIHVAMNSAPNGYLKANGQAVSRSVYAALFAAIGTTYGAGNGSTTFNVPDLRGEFVRGWDDGRGVDSGRAIGSSQDSQMQSHTHTTAVGSRGLSSGAGNAIGTGTGVNLTSSAAGGTSNSSENRPRNVALLACIKF